MSIISARSSAPRALVLLAVFGLAAVLWAAPANATCASPCHWFSGALSNNYGYASIEAHSLTYVQGDANHNEFCIAAEQGSAGSYYDPSGGDCQVYSSGSFAAAAFYSGNCCYHATIVNLGPLSSITVSSATHYDY